MPLKITIIAVGKPKNTGLSAALAPLEKKLKHYVQLQMVFTKDVRRSKHSVHSKTEEAKLIEAKIPSDAYLVVLDERGKLQNTQQMVEWWTGLERQCVGHVAFVIGGPDGLAPSIVKKANRLLALSPLTFTHEMAHFILTEQLYRILSFRSGHPYHRV